MSDLQSDSTPAEPQAEQEVENVQVTAELDTASEAQHEEQAQAEPTIDNENIQKVINKKHFEAKEAQRQAEEYKKRLDEIEARQREEEAKRYSSIPERPDPFDDDYDEKIALYEQQLQQKAQWDFQQKLAESQRLSAQQAEQAKQAQEMQDKASAYTSKAKSLGISAEELQMAGNAVAQYGINDDLTMAILQDSDGPLITKYLASNPADIADLNSMNPYVAGAKLAEIKQKAAQLKPKQTNAPEPATRVDGIAADQTHPALHGVKYE